MEDIRNNNGKLPQTVSGLTTPPIEPSLLLPSINSSSLSTSTISILSSLYASLHIPKPRHHHILCLGNNETNLGSIRSIFDNLTGSTTDTPKSSSSSLPPSNGQQRSSSVHYVGYTYQPYDPIYQKSIEYGYISVDQDKHIYRNNASLIQMDNNNNRIHYYGINTETCKVLQLSSLLHHIIPQQNNNNYHKNTVHTFTIMMVVDCANPFTIPEQLNSLVKYRNELVSSLVQDGTTVPSITCMYILSNSEQLIDDGSFDIFTHQLKSSNTLSVNLISYLLSNPCRILGNLSYSVYLYWYVRSRAVMDNLYHPILQQRIGFACLPLDTSLTIYQTIGKKLLTYISMLGTLSEVSLSVGGQPYVGTNNNKFTSVHVPTSVTRDTTFMMINQDTYDNVHQYFVTNIRPWIHTHIENILTKTNDWKMYYSVTETEMYQTFYSSLCGSGSTTTTNDDVNLLYTCLCTYYSQMITLSLYNQSKLVLLGVTTNSGTNESSPYYKNFLTLYWWNTLLSNTYNHQNNNSSNNNLRLDYRSKILSLGAFTMFLLTGIHPMKSASSSLSSNGSRLSMIGPGASSLSRTSIGPTMHSRSSIIQSGSSSSSSTALHGFAKDAVNTSTPTAVAVQSRVSTIVPNTVVFNPSVPVIPTVSVGSRQTIGGGNSNTVVPRASFAPSSSSSSTNVTNINVTTTNESSTNQPSINSGTQPPINSRSSILINNNTAAVIPPSSSGNTAVPPKIPTNTDGTNTTENLPHNRDNGNSTKPPTARVTRSALTKSTVTTNGGGGGGEKDPSKFFKSLLEKPTVGTTKATTSTSNNSNGPTNAKNL